MVSPHLIKFENPCNRASTTLSNWAWRTSWRSLHSELLGGRL